MNDRPLPGVKSKFFLCFPNLLVCPCPLFLPRLLTALHPASQGVISPALPLPRKPRPVRWIVRSLRRLQECACSHARRQRPSPHRTACPDRPLLSSFGALSQTQTRSRQLSRPFRGFPWLPDSGALVLTPAGPLAPHPTGAPPPWPWRLPSPWGLCTCCPLCLEGSSVPNYAQVSRGRHSPPADTHGTLNHYLGHSCN